MSESNNNTPMRITQLEEATAYEDGMFFAVAKAGRGTFKIPTSEMTPNEQALSDKIENEIVPAVENSFAYGTVDESEIACFLDGSELPLKDLEIRIEPQQEGSGDPSPTNIRPISGWDEVNVTRCGKNLIPSITEGMDLISATGDARESVGWYLINYIGIEVGKTYFLSGTSSATVCYYDKHKTFTRTTLNTRNIVPQEGECYVRCNSLIDGYSEPQIEEGNEATSFSPFGQTYTIDLDGTRYGGKVDLVSGELVVDMAEIDLGDLTWTKENNHFYSNFLSDANPPSINSQPANMLCEAYENMAYSQVITETNDASISLSNSKRIYIYDSTKTSLDGSAFKTAMNGVRLVYELATPIEVQLTPTQVKSLKGYNNFSANTGNILKVEYIRDLDIVINSLLERIAALEG